MCCPYFSVGDDDGDDVNARTYSSKQWCNHSCHEAFLFEIIILEIVITQRILLLLLILLLIIIATKLVSSSKEELEEQI